MGIINDTLLRKTLRYMERTAEQWSVMLELYDYEMDKNGVISEEYVSRAMSGHALLDDPGDMSERDLYMFGAGYLRAYAIQSMNSATELKQMVHSLRAALGLDAEEVLNGTTTD